MEATNVKASPEKTGLDIEKEKRKQKALDITKATGAYLFLTICAFFAFLPFYWMIISSLKTEDEYRLTTPTFFPKEFKWQNYSYMLTNVNNKFGQALFNTVLICVVSTIFGIVVIILTAYALARIEFKGKGILFSIMLGTMMIPGELYTITNYVTVSKLCWTNTYIVMILQFLVSIYYIYLLRNTFKSIPESLYKAAKVDGCGNMRFLVKVMIPLAAPTLISITLLKFIATWNSYIWPRLVNTEDYHLISNWMTSGFSNDGTLYPTNLWPKGDSLTTLRMCAACLVSFPLFKLFMFFRKYIMHGVSKS
jgi:multiple sugar transport system permease protein